jgi:hypothetical protein
MQLAPKPGGMRVERSGPRNHPVPPDLLEELGLREHPVGLARQAEQQLVLLLRQVHSPAPDANRARAHIDPHRRDVDDVIEPRLSAAEHRPNPLDELLILEWGRNVVVASSPERLNPIDGIGLLAAEHDHRCALDPLVDRRSVAGEDEVEPRVSANELEAVTWQMTFEKATRLGLGVGKQQRCGN